MTYSPWSKICFDAIRFIGMDGRSECGLVAAAVLVEKAGQTKKTLRVTLPVRVSLERGVRIVVDQGQPFTGLFVGCFPNGCPADYEGGVEKKRIEEARKMRCEGATPLP
jgi:invasion associated locus B (IalB) protein